MKLFPFEVHLLFQKKVFDETFYFSSLIEINQLIFK